MSKIVNKNCPVSTTLSLIGGKYKALLLWHLTDQTLRFSELHKLVPEATPKMLTQQLRELEEDGLLSRKVYPEVPPKVEYSLTETGKSLSPILASLYDWGAALMQQEGRCPECSMTRGEQKKQGVLCHGKCTPMAEAESRLS